MYRSLEKVVCVVSVLVMINAAFFGVVDAKDSIGIRETLKENESNTEGTFLDTSIADSSGDENSKTSIGKANMEIADDNDANIEKAIETIDENPSEELVEEINEHSEDNIGKVNHEQVKTMNIGQETIEVDILKENKELGVIVGIDNKGSANIDLMIEPMHPFNTPMGDIGKYFEISASNSESFSAFIKIHYEDDDVRPGIREEDLVMYYLDGEEWRIVNDASLGEETSVDTRNNFVWAKTSHFG